MDAYVISLLAKGAGSVLSRQAAIMNRALADSLEDPEVILSFEFGFATTKDGKRHPMYLEADADSIELYTRIGAERDPMLVCLRSGSGFVVTGGRFAPDLHGSDI